MRNHLGEEIKLGPTPQVELDVIKSLIKMCKPKTIVEIGHLHGHSAREFLSVMDKNQKLYSFDPTVDSSITDERFVFYKTAQEDYNPNMVPEGIDLIFIDGSHDIQKNIKMFEKLNLNDEAIIVVHDTGAWDIKVISDIPNEFNMRVGDLVFHRPDEVVFVNYLEKQGFHSINLNTTKEFRCGLTILQ